MKKESNLFLLVFILFLLNTPHVKAQLSAPDSDATEKTQYPVFQAIDNIYIFCTENEEEKNATLQATTPLEGTKTFFWEKYNKETSSFEYFSEETDAQQSTISSLNNGCYRVTITRDETSEVYRAWVFNNWYTADPDITDSNCESFKLSGNYVSPDLNYNDLADNTEINIPRNINYEWKENETIIASVQNPQNFKPPTQDTEYTFRVNDRFGCGTTARTTYESVVTKAAFTVDPQEGEAPLTVNFTNKSENGDYFKWSLYKDLDLIKQQSENSGAPYDSIIIEPINENLEYTYEKSGTYNVRLVSTTQTETGNGELLTCMDTAYLEGYIVVDTSFVAVPNVFTPNGDGINDMFIVKFWSMQNIKISIFNRWGKRIHFWKSNDIRGFEDTYTKTVWDGRLGGRYASPGVYYYVVEGRGRDDKKRRANGFFHLFRDKN